MKIAIATRPSGQVTGHAGQTRRWLLYTLPETPTAPLPAAQCIELARHELMHHFRDVGPHPLDGVAILVAGSAGDGFVRRLHKRGTRVLLTGERDPAVVVERLRRGQPLPPQRFELGTALCKLRDLLSRH